MSESTPHNDESIPEIPLEIHRENLRAIYCNAFQSSAGAEEVFLSLGINRLVRDIEGKPLAVQLNLDTEVVMNYPTAKRLAIMMAQMVRDYEGLHGEVDLGEVPKA